jgi:hypothetical protein
MSCAKFVTRQVEVTVSGVVLRELGRPVMVGRKGWGLGLDIC